MGCGWVAGGEEGSFESIVGVSVLCFLSGLR